MKRIIAAASALLALGSLAFAEDAKAALSKDETVYAVLDAKGGVKSLWVSDWLHGEPRNGELRDRSDLFDIENVKAKDAPRKNGGELVWTPAGNDVYYRGKSSKDLPFSIKVSYWLDGKKVEPEAIVGMSGLVRIKVEVKNLAIAKAAGAPGIRAPLVALVGTALPSALFRDIEVKGGKLVTDGQNNIVAGLLLPGLLDSVAAARTAQATPSGSAAILDYVRNLVPGDEFEVTATTSGFKLGPVMALVTTSLPELGAKDVSSAKGKLRETLDGIAQLGEASAAIRSGSSQLAAGASQLHEGIAAAAGATKPLFEPNPSLERALGFVRSDEDIAAARRLVAEGRKLAASAPELLDLLAAALDPASKAGLERVMADAKGVDMKALMGAPLATKAVSEESLAAMAEAMKASDELYSGFDEARLAALGDFAAGSPALLDAVQRFDEAASGYERADGEAMAALAAARPAIEAARIASASFDARAAAAALADSARAQEAIAAKAGFLADAASAGALRAKLASGEALTKDESAALASLLESVAADRAALGAGAAAARSAAAAMPALAGAAAQLPVASQAAAAAAKLGAKVLPALDAARRDKLASDVAVAAAKKALDPKAVKSISANVRKIAAAKKAYEKNESAMKLARTYLALRARQGGFKGQLEKLESLQKDAADLAPLLEKAEAIMNTEAAKSLLGSPGEAKASFASLKGSVERLSPYLDLCDAALAPQSVEKARELVGKLPELKSGLEQLDSGSALLAEKLGELAAGTARFDEEGMKRLTSELGEIGNAVLGCLSAGDILAAAAKEYRIFTQAPAEAKTSLKYIVRTEEVK